MNCFDGAAFNETKDLYLLLTVLQKRFKKIKIVTSRELIEHQDKVEQDLNSFFA